MDVLTDFTMWREIRIFISAGLVCCAWSIMYCMPTLTIFLKKIKPRLVYHKKNVEMLHVFKIEHHSV